MDHRMRDQGHLGAGGLLLPLLDPDCLVDLLVSLPALVLVLILTLPLLSLGLANLAEINN